MLDKTKAATHRVVGAAIQAKNVAELADKRDSPTEFGSEIIRDTSEETARGVVSQTTMLITRNAKRKSKAAKEKNNEQKADSSVKENTRQIKTAQQAQKMSVKTPAATFSREQTQAANAENAAKRASKVEKAVRESMKRAAQSAKDAARSLMKTVKGIIAATKTMVAALAAGSSVTVVALVSICAIALLLGSAFGIFFSNETDGVKMKDAVADLSAEYYDEVKRIEASVAHDRVEYVANDGVNSLRWQDILSVYAVKLSANNSSGMEVVTLTEQKKAVLRDIMWEMTELDYSTRAETIEIEVVTINEDGEEVIEIQQIIITILTVVITHISPEEMAARYSFDRMQNEQLSLLKDPEYSPYWAALLGGFLSGNGEIIVTDADWVPTGSFTWPLPFNGTFTSPFGYRHDPYTGEVSFHGGIDLGAATGTPILAADGGTVVVANATDPYYGYGYYVMIDHGNGFATLYGHCSSIGVVAGQAVSRGEVIAQVGSTGKSTGPHLHFEVLQGGVRVDPLNFFRQ